MPNKAKLKGVKPTEVQFVRQSNKTVLVNNADDSETRWSFTLTEKEFSDGYEIIEEEAKE